MRTGNVDRTLWPLYDLPSLKLEWCAVCGRTWPLNEHHVIRRGDGNVFEDGKVLEKPTITLCGHGNNLRDADGRYWCHGLAHHQMLHFRWVDDEPTRPTDQNEHPPCAGHLEYLRTAEPTDYQVALGMDGWRRVRCRP